MDFLYLFISLFWGNECLLSFCRFFSFTWVIWDATSRWLPLSPARCCWVLEYVLLHPSSWGIDMNWTADALKSTLGQLNCVSHWKCPVKNLFDCSPWHQFFCWIASMRYTSCLHLFWATWRDAVCVTIVYLYYFLQSFFHCHPGSPVFGIKRKKFISSYTVTLLLKPVVVAVCHFFLF